MRFFSVLFLGVCCYSQNATNSEPVVTSLTPEIANPPKETQASIDARLALISVCPEVTSNCSVPNGTVAQNDALADALDCMLRVNISTVAPGPCHDALAKFLNDHLNPRVDPRMVDPRMVDPRMVDPRIAQMQAQIQAARMQQMQQDPRVAQLQAQMQMRQMQQMQQDPRIAQLQAQMQMRQMQQDPRIAQLQAQMQMAQMRQMQSSQSSQNSHGSQFPMLLVVRSQQPQQQSQPGPVTVGSLLQRMMAARQQQQQQPMMSPFTSQFSHSQSFRGPQSPSSRFQHSSRGSSRSPSRFSRGGSDSTSRSSFPSHGFSLMSNERRAPMPWMSRQQDSHRYDSSSRFSGSRQQSQRYWSPPQGSMRSPRDMSSSRSHHDMPSRSHQGPSRGSGPSSSMNPMMMMMLPQLMKGSSSEKNPMSGLMMITLIKKMTSSSSDDYAYQSDDYDYDYTYGSEDDDYDYDYTYSTDMDAADYDYDYIYEDAAAASPSPLSGIIQQMLRAKMAAQAQQTPVKVTVTPIGSGVSTPRPVNVPAIPATPETPDNVEISAPASQPRPAKVNRPVDQVSYRNAP